MSNRINAQIDIREFKHPGWRSMHPSAKWYEIGETTVCIAVENGMWHLSISCQKRDPTWDEIATARYRLIPKDVTMAMLLPPLTEYVNLHDHVFHLHEIND